MNSTDNSTGAQQGTPGDLLGGRQGARGVKPLVPAGVTQLLAPALHRHFTTAAVQAALGLAGTAALDRADLAAVARCTRERSPTNVLVRLFLLGTAESAELVGAALAPLTVRQAVIGGLLTAHADMVRAALEVRPYAEQDGPQWWVLSDLAADVRPGPLAADHVLGIGAAATTLAQAVIRRPVKRALDIGTGCGVQALHLARHAEQVTATDVSPRALSIAASTAELNGLDWTLQTGSLLAPVAGEEFDLIVCNPPFVVGPGFGTDGYSYRDSGLAGDAVSAQLVRAIPVHLAPGGTGQLLANWVITGRQSWTERVQEWLSDSDCDAWVWQREVAEPGEYVSMWLRDAGETPGSALWQQRYDHWLDWFDQTGVLAVGMGMLTLRRTTRPPQVVCEEVPQAYEQPIGPAIADWFDRQDWLRQCSDHELARTALRASPEQVLIEQSLTGPAGWQLVMRELRQSHGMRWQFEVDEAVAGLIAASTGKVPVGLLLDLLAVSFAQIDDSDLQSLPQEQEMPREQAMVMVRQLIQRGVLLPPPD